MHQAATRTQSLASVGFFPEDVTNPAKRQALIELIRWVLTDGQAEAEGALYAPLPSRIREMELKTLSTIH
jgi:hypothetical protein